MLDLISDSPFSGSSKLNQQIFSKEIGQSSNLASYHHVQANQRVSIFVFMAVYKGVQGVKGAFRGAISLLKANFT